MTVDSKLQLEAQERKIKGKAVKKLRQESKIPACLYGHGLESQNIFVFYNPFKNVFDRAGESTLIDLNINGEPRKVLIQDVQYEPVRGDIIHIDFREVSMTEKLEVAIPIKLVGEARAVKELGGVLVKNIDELRVKCLPGALVHEIEISLSGLNEFGNVVKVSDISLPEGIEVLHEGNATVITVVAPREEEVVEAVAEAPDLSAIKTVSEEKRAAKAAEKSEEEVAAK